MVVNESKKVSFQGRVWRLVFQGQFIYNPNRIRYCGGTMNEGHGEGGWFKTLLICGGLLVGKKQKTPNINFS